MASASKKEIRVGLVFGSDRYSAKYPYSFSVWEMLASFERTNKIPLTSSSDPLGTWFQPVLTIGEKKLDNLFLLCHTLKQLRIATKGGVLINVNFAQAPFKLTDLPMQLEEAREKVKAKFPAKAKNPAVSKMEIDSAASSSKESEELAYPDLTPGKTKPTSRDFGVQCGKVSRKLYEFLSGIADPGEWETARKTTRAIIKNLKKEDEKFQRFKRTHPAIQQKVLRHAGAEEFFSTVGFKPFDSDYLGFAPNVHPEEIEMYIDRTLREIENARYVPPVQPIPDVPVSTKVWSRENLRAKKQAYAAANKKESTQKSLVAQAYSDLKTKRDLLYPTELMSESLRKKKLGIVDRKYAHTMIHVEFPSGLILEGMFHPKNPVRKLREYVFNSLRPEAQPYPFDLLIPPQKILKDDSQTFKEAGLVPAGIVRFRGGTFNRDEPKRKKVSTQIQYVLDDRLLEIVDKSEYSPVPTAVNAQKATAKKTQKKKNAFAKNLLGKRR